MVSTYYFPNCTDCIFSLIIYHVLGPGNNEATENRFLPIAAGVTGAKMEICKFYVGYKDINKNICR